MRQFGILAPISSLPSKEGIGTLGQGAYDFIDYISSAGAKIWQILPLSPLSYGNSPYQPCASEAFCHYYIDLETLKADGLLFDDDYAADDLIRGERVDYGLQFFNKTQILKKAFARFDRSSSEWSEFKKSGRYDDFALFYALKEKFSFKSRTEWGDFKRYDKEKVDEFARENADSVDFWLFTQYVFLKQWRALREYSRKKGISILGDLPVYLAFDGVEAWKYGSELFQFDDDGEPKFVAGVPPDAFSADGQLWGNPVYDWEKMKKDDYAWQKKRIASALEIYDIVRLDHFRSFDRYYRIKNGETTARNGEWVDGPKSRLFESFKNSPLIAEDLGLIDDGARALMRETGFPGMKVMSFCFDLNPYGEHRPSNYPKNCAAYTGTHDNSPLAALIDSASEEYGKVIDAVLKDECLKLGASPRLSSTTERVNTAIRLLFASNADIVVVPMADVKGFGEEARINEPSKLSDDNWTFRFKPTDFDEATKRRIRNYARKYGR